MLNELMRKNIYRGKLQCKRRSAHVDKEEAKRFGEVIRRRRQELGLSTHDLGRIIGTRNSTIIRIEQGAFAAPRPDKLAHIAQALHFSLADIYARAGYAVPEDLPGFHAYLPARYRDLPEEAIGQLSALFNSLVAKYGLDVSTDQEDAINDASGVAANEAITLSEGVSP